MKLLSLRGREVAAAAAVMGEVVEGGAVGGPSTAVQVPRPRDNDRYTSLMVSGC